MTKVIVEHATKTPNIKLSVFVDEVKVGDLSHRMPLEVDVSAGEHSLHVSLAARKKEGLGVPFYVGEGQTKKIRTGLTVSAFFAARWHFFLLVMALGALSLSVSGLLFNGMIRQSHLLLAAVLLPVSIPTYFFVNAKRAKNPKNFVEIKVLE